MFREELPDQCPPEYAQETAHASIFRAVMSNPPTDDDFKSQRLKGRPALGVDACRHASCSFFTKRDKAANIAGKLPKPREGGPFVAEFSFLEGAGRSHLKKQHVDMWFYAEFDPGPCMLSIGSV